MSTLAGAAAGRTLWRVAVTVPAAGVGAFADGLGDGAAAVATFEADPDGRDWLVETTWATPPDRRELASRCALLAAALEIPEPALTVEPIAEADWLKRSLDSFPPLRIGRYFVRGPHVKEPTPAGLLPLEVAAATAFGSGEHASTSGCLLAFRTLLRGRAARSWRALDLGCGSGILALGIAKLRRRPVLAVDIDPEAVRVARENADRNGVRRLVRTAVGDGYRTAAIRRARPFDLVAANILARPLARMARPLAHALRPGGVAVLAGLLQRQETLVLGAHRLAGLRLVRRVRQDGWSTLVIARPRRAPADAV